MYTRLIETINDTLTFAVTALVFGVIKVLTSQSNMPTTYKVLSVVTSVLVGTLAGQVALELQLKDFLALTIASVFSLLARDIVHALLDKQFMKAMAQRAAENIVDKVTK